jgi:hypothetical protein
MSNATQTARADLAPVLDLHPLQLLSAQEVNQALQDGGMYPPHAGSRDSMAGLQWRPDIEFCALLETALTSIRGAQGVLMGIAETQADEVMSRTAQGLLQLMETAGGAVCLALRALHAVEGRPAEMVTPELIQALTRARSP